MECSQNQLFDLQIIERKNMLLNAKPISRKHSNLESETILKLLLTDHFVNKIRNALDSHNQSHAGSQLL